MSVSEQERRQRATEWRNSGGASNSFDDLPHDALRDVIDERKDERERVQAKVFARWINAQFRRSTPSSGSVHSTPTTARSPAVAPPSSPAPPPLITNLFHDLTDGYKLVALLGQLLQTKIPVEKGSSRAHQVLNIKNALKVLEANDVHLVNVSAEDIAEGNRQLTLSLVWAIIQHWQIKRIVDVTSGDEFRARNIDKTLLTWCQMSTKGYKHVDVRNLMSSFSDGLAFNALIHRYRPELFDYDKLLFSGRSASENLQHAFSIAHRALGVEPLLDPEDLVSNTPDKKCIITYLLTLLEALPHEPVSLRALTAISELGTSAGDESKENIADMQADSNFSSSNRSKLASLRPATADAAASSSSSSLFPTNNNNMPSTNSSTKRFYTTADVETFQNSVESVLAYLIAANDKMDQIDADASTATAAAANSADSSSSEVARIKQQFRAHQDFMADLSVQQNTIIVVLQRGQSIIDCQFKEFLSSGYTVEDTDAQMKLIGEKWEALRVRAQDKQNRLRNELMSRQQRQLQDAAQHLDEFDRICTELKRMPVEHPQEASEKLQRLTELQQDLEAYQSTISELSDLLIVVDTDTEEAGTEMEAQLAKLADRWTDVCGWIEAELEATETIASDWPDYQQYYAEALEFIGNIYRDFLPPQSPQPAGQANASVAAERNAQQQRCSQLIAEQHERITETMQLGRCILDVLPQQHPLHQQTLQNQRQLRAKWNTLLDDLGRRIYYTVATVDAGDKQVAVVNKHKLDNSQVQSPTIQQLSTKAAQQQQQQQQQPTAAPQKRQKLDTPNASAGADSSRFNPSSFFQWLSSVEQRIDVMKNAAQTSGGQHGTLDGGGNDDSAEIETLAAELAQHENGYVELMMSFSNSNAASNNDEEARISEATRRWNTASSFIQIRKHEIEQTRERLRLNAELGEFDTKLNRAEEVSNEAEHVLLRLRTSTSDDGDVAMRDADQNVEQILNNKQSALDETVTWLNSAATQQKLRTDLRKRIRSHASKSDSDSDKSLLPLYEQICSRATAVAERLQQLSSKFSTQLPTHRYFSQCAKLKTALNSMQSRYQQPFSLPMSLERAETEILAVKSALDDVLGPQKALLDEINQNPLQQQQPDDTSGHTAQLELVELNANWRSLRDTLARAYSTLSENNRSVQQFLMEFNEIDADLRDYESKLNEVTGGVAVSPKRAKARRKKLAETYKNVLLAQDQREKFEKMLRHGKELLEPAENADTKQFRDEIAMKLNQIQQKWDELDGRSRQALGEDRVGQLVRSESGNTAPVPIPTIDISKAQKVDQTDEFSRQTSEANLPPTPAAPIRHQPPEWFSHAERLARNIHEVRQMLLDQLNSMPSVSFSPPSPQSPSSSNEADETDSYEKLTDIYQTLESIKQQVDAQYQEDAEPLAAAAGAILSQHDFCYERDATPTGDAASTDVARHRHLSALAQARVELLDAWNACNTQLDQKINSCREALTRWRQLNELTSNEHAWLDTLEQIIRQVRACEDAQARLQLQPVVEAHLNTIRQDNYENANNIADELCRNGIMPTTVSRQIEALHERRKNLVSEIGTLLKDAAAAEAAASAKTAAVLQTTTSSSSTASTPARSQQPATSVQQLEVHSSGPASSLTSPTGTAERRAMRDGLEDALNEQREVLQQILNEFNNKHGQLEVKTGDPQVLRAQQETCIGLYQRLSQVKVPIETLIKQGRQRQQQLQLSGPPEEAESLSTALTSLKELYNTLGAQVTLAKNELDKAYKDAKKIDKELAALDNIADKIGTQWNQIEQQHSSKSSSLSENDFKQFTESALETLNDKKQALTLVGKARDQYARQVLMKPIVPHLDDRLKAVTQRYAELIKTMRTIISTPTTAEAAHTQRFTATATIEREPATATRSTPAANVPSSPPKTGENVARAIESAKQIMVTTMRKSPEKTTTAAEQKSVVEQKPTVVEPKSTNSSGKIVEPPTPPPPAFLNENIFQPVQLLVDESMQRELTRLDALKHEAENYVSVEKTSSHIENIRDFVTRISRRYTDLDTMRKQCGEIMHKKTMLESWLNKRKDEIDTVMLNESGRVPSEQQCAQNLGVCRHLEGPSGNSGELYEKGRSVAQVIDDLYALQERYRKSGDDIATRPEMAKTELSSAYQAVKNRVSYANKSHQSLMKVYNLLSAFEPRLDDAVTRATNLANNVKNLSAGGDEAQNSANLRTTLEVLNAECQAHQQSVDAIRKSSETLHTSLFPKTTTSSENDDEPDSLDICVERVATKWRAFDDELRQIRAELDAQQQLSPKTKSSPPTTTVALAAAAKKPDRESTPATATEVEHEAVVVTKTKLDKKSTPLDEAAAAQTQNRQQIDKNNALEAELVALIDLCRSKHDEFDATMTTISGDTSPPSTLEQLERLADQQRIFCERELDSTLRERIEMVLGRAENDLKMVNGNAATDDDSSLRVRVQQLREAWRALDEHTQHEQRTTNEAVQSLRALWADIGDAVSRIRAMDEERSKKWEPVEDVMINDLPLKMDELRRYRERLDSQSARMNELKQHEALVVDDRRAVDAATAKPSSRHRRRRHIAPAIAEEFLLELNNADSFLKELMQAAADRHELLDEAQRQLGQQQQQQQQNAGTNTAEMTGNDKLNPTNGVENHRVVDAGKLHRLLASSVSPPYERCIAATNNNVPYYINHDSHATQWDHPKFAELHQLLEDISQGVKYAAYRVAMRLRAIQKKLYLDLLTLEVANEAFHEHLSSTNDIDAPLDCDTMSKCLLQMYERMSVAHPQVINVPVGVDLCLNFVLSVCDPERLGFVKEMSFKTLLVLLCNGAVQHKYRCVFRMIVDTRGRADHDRFARFMRECIQLPRYLGELNAFGGEDVESSVQSCFATVEAKEINTTQLLKWIGQEPQSLVWLTVLHRLILAENTRHSVHCSVCHTHPIVGLRYRSLIKFNLDLCQACFLSGRYLKKHKEYHPMQEYCLPTTSGEAFRDLRRIVGNKFKSKGYFRRHPRRGYLPVGSSSTPSKSQENDDSIATTTSVSATTSAMNTPARGGVGYHSMRAQSTPPRGPPPVNMDQSSSAGGDASRSGTLNTTKTADDALDAATYGARIVNNIENDLSTSSSPPSLPANGGNETKKTRAVTLPSNNSNVAAQTFSEENMLAAGERDEHSLIKRYCDVLKQQNFDGGAADDINDVSALNCALLSGPDSVMQTAERGVRYESHDYLRQLQQDHDRLLHEFEMLNYGQQQLQNGSEFGQMLNADEFSPFEDQQFLMQQQQQQNSDFSATAASDVLTTERRALQIEKTRMEAQMRMLQDHNRQLDAQLKRIKGLISDAQGAAALTAAAGGDGHYAPAYPAKMNGTAAMRGAPYGQQQQQVVDQHNYSAGYGDANNNLLFASPLSPHSQTFSAGMSHTGAAAASGTLPYAGGGGGFGGQQQQHLSARGSSFRGYREDFADLHGTFQRNAPVQYSTPPRRRQQPITTQQRSQQGDGSKASVGQLLNAVGDLNNKLGKLVTVMTDDEEGSGATSSYENHQPRNISAAPRENNSSSRHIRSSDRPTKS